MRNPYNVDWDSQAVLTTLAGLPELAGTCRIGVGRRAAVFAPTESTSVFKVTCEEVAYRFLEESAPLGLDNLPRVEALYGRVAQLEGGVPLYMVKLERLSHPDKPLQLAKKIHKVWSKVITRNPELSAIPNCEVLKNDLIQYNQVFDFIESFTKRTNSCFDGDTFCNILFRTDGTLVFSDPVLDLSSR